MTIIFDFDGTIADSFSLIVDVFKGLTKNEQQFTPEQMNELRDLPLIAVAHRLHVPAWQVPFLLYRGRRIMGRRLKEISPFAGMPGVIEKLHAEGHELFIMSSNSKRNIRRFLKQHHMYTFFVDIKGNVGLFGKPRALRNLIHKNSFKEKDCYYVGDESRDIEAAKAVGTHSIAVLWGFARDETLIGLQPTATAAVPVEIIQALER